MKGFKLTNPEVIVLSDDAYDRLVKIIEAPSKPTPTLVALMRRKPIWKTP